MSHADAEAKVKALNEVSIEECNAWKTCSRKSRFEPYYESDPFEEPSYYGPKDDEDTDDDLPPSSGLEVPLLP